MTPYDPGTANSHGVVSLMSRYSFLTKAQRICFSLSSPQSTLMDSI